ASSATPKRRLAMTDRYERIRAALEMGPTPGPWSPSYDKGSTRDIFTEQGKLPVCMVRWVTYVGQEQYLANGHFIAACDPDTIRELLEERDELAKLVAEMRGTLRDLRIHLHAAGRRPEECYEMSMIDDALHLAAIDQARGEGGP